MSNTNDIPEERWLPIPGYEGFYEASDQGRVRGLERRIPTSRGIRRYPCKVLKQKCLNKNGDYYGVVLSREGIPKAMQVHRLVLMAFVGPCPDGMEACHNNGISSDNRPENLRWDTRRNNFLDRLRHGTGVVCVPKTECKRGHEFTPENTIVRTLGKECRACARMHAKNAWARRVAQNSNAVSA